MCTHLFVDFESCELRGGIRKDAHHLGAVAFVECKKRFFSYDMSEATEHAQMLVVHRMRLEQNLDAVERGDGGFRAHAGYAYFGGEII